MSKIPVDRADGGPYVVAALYHFARLEDPAALKAPLAELCCGLEVRGTLLLASEGINGTIAGHREAIDRVLAHIRAIPGLSALEHKESQAEKMPFRRMKVRLKREIVTMGVEGVDPLEGVGAYVDPKGWNELIADPDTLVIDTRNDYEVAIGTFAGAVNPQTGSFREFPDWLEKTAETEKPARIAMFCTGGIRCEKATAYMRARGFDNVFHLKGGILKYLEEVPKEDSLWEGNCFVFDERVSVGHGLQVGEESLCRACRLPLTQDDRMSELYEEGVSCPHCHGERSEADRERYRARHRQMLAAAEKARRSGDAG